MSRTKLTGQLFGVLGALDEVVDVGAEESGDAFEEGHGEFLSGTSGAEALCSEMSLRHG